jgi:hypothetical protein
MSAMLASPSVATPAIAETDVFVRLREDVRDTSSPAPRRSSAWTARGSASRSRARVGGTVPREARTGHLGHWLGDAPMTPAETLAISVNEQRLGRRFGPKEMAILARWAELADCVGYCRRSSTRRGKTSPTMSCEWGYRRVSAIRMFTLFWQSRLL